MLTVKQKNNRDKKVKRREAKGKSGEGIMSRYETVSNENSKKSQRKKRNKK